MMTNIRLLSRTDWRLNAKLIAPRFSSIYLFDSSLFNIFVAHAADALQIFYTDSFHLI